jgi:hypothetical protein
LREQNFPVNDPIRVAGELNILPLPFLPDKTPYFFEDILPAWAVIFIWSCRPLVVKFRKKICVFVIFIALKLRVSADFISKKECEEQ